MHCDKNLCQLSVMEDEDKEYVQNLIELKNCVKMLCVCIKYKQTNKKI